jgi:general secretion pathway protein G
MGKRAVSVGLSTKGFSLVELVMVVMILTTVAAIAIPSYSEAVNAARIVRAISDVKGIANEIDLYFLANNAYPKTLDDVLGDVRKDSWGHPYQYLSFAGLKGKGKMRKDKNLVPLNSDYDLYSMGRDGKSVSPITAKQSRDDIIRANNGGFIGLAENY